MRCYYSIIDGEKNPNKSDQILCIATPTAINLRADNPGTCDYVGISEWAQLDLQSIQHCDYFGHLSIFGIKLLKWDVTTQLLMEKKPK